MINLLASQKYDYLKQSLLKKQKDFKNITIEEQCFPDGERYFRIKNIEDIAGKPAVYICGTVNDEAILEAYNMGCTLVREGCSSLHLVIPYYGYSTMERTSNSGENVSAKNIAHLFSAIPLAAQGNHIYMVDLHSLSIQYYFEQNIHPVHLSTEPIIDKIIKEIKKGRKVVLASTDVGRVKWVEKTCSRLGLDGAYIIKKRLSGSETAVEAFNADVKGKDVIIFDDMIRSGSSIIGAAKTYKSLGAKDIFVVCVHGVFVEGAIEKMKKSGLIKGIYCTNTHANTQSIKDKFVHIYDMSAIIKQGLKLNLID